MKFLKFEMSWYAVSHISSYCLEMLYVTTNFLDNCIVIMLLKSFCHL